MKGALRVITAVCLSANAALNAQSGAESRNMVLVGHNDLNGNGDGAKGWRCSNGPMAVDCSTSPTKRPNAA